MRLRLHFQNLIKDAGGRLFLRELGQFRFGVCGDERYNIGIGSKACARHLQIVGQIFGCPMVWMKRLDLSEVTSIL